MSFQVGDTVGDYQIIGLLGAGGMGRVYKVKNTISDRVDALKVLLPNLADDQGLADRFMREIKVLASLNHPNIAGLRTAFRLENQLLMVMEYVEGTSLDERCKAGRIPMEDAINYIQQALAALGFAHKHGVIHRDIKPANMMLTPDGVVKLMDFGIAKSKADKKLTQTGTTLGSLFYMSAEQVQGNELDGRSDLYSIGVSLYEMVTGTRPFQGKSDFDIMIAQLQQAPQPPIQMLPDLPKALNDIIMISLEKDPANRFQTAEAFSAALGSITGSLSATPVQASVGGMTTPLTPPAPLTVPQPVAVGGTVSGPRGYIPTANMPTVMAPQPEAPAAAALPPPVPSHGVPAPSASKGYRGLYMALGALIVVAILAVAAVEGTRFLKARAGGDQTAQVAANTPNSATPGTSTPGTSAPGTSTPDAGAPPATGAGTSPTASTTPGPDTNQTAGASGVGNGAGNGLAPSGTPGASAGTSLGLPSSGNPGNAGGSATPSAKTTKTKSTALNQAAGGGMSGAASGAGGGAGQGTQQAPANTGVNAQKLAEMQDLHDKLSIRAGSVDQRVEDMRKGMGPNNLNPVISTAQTRMRVEMNAFDKAMNAGDLDAAESHMRLAEHEIEFLEKKFNM